MNTKLLEDIGLTKGEITVYLTLLKLGETTTGRIIDEAQISSGKIYEILDKLIKKGLASYIIKEKTKYFNATSPNRILDFLYEKEKQIKDKEKELEKEIPSLIKLQMINKKEHETYLYKGYKGIQTAIFGALENLNQNNEVLAMGVISSKDEKYNLLWQNWHNERIKRKIKCKIIFSEKGEYYETFKKIRLADVKLLEGITPSAIDIMGNNALIFTYGEEPSCLFISNKEIANSFTTFFNTLWKIAKKN